MTVVCSAPPDLVDSAIGTLSWDIVLEPGRTWQQRLGLTAAFAGTDVAVAAPTGTAPTWSALK